MHYRIFLLLALFAVAVPSAPVHAAHKATAVTGCNTATPTDGAAVLVGVRAVPAWKVRTAAFAFKIARWVGKFAPAAPPSPDGESASETEGLAIAALVCGIVGVTFIPVLGSIAAIILASMALNRIEENGKKGKGMATAGLVLGILGVVYIALIIFLAATGGL